MEKLDQSVFDKKAELAGHKLANSAVDLIDAGAAVLATLEYPRARKNCSAVVVRRKSVRTPCSRA
jgi:hypothetical protein